MVAVGTAIFINPRAPLVVLTGIKAYLKEHKIDDIRQLIGSIKDRDPS
jgi:dihydroorotate dehydrogenase (NAD+) catalytic subunit